MSTTTPRSTVPTTRRPSATAPPVKYGAVPRMTTNALAQAMTVTTMATRTPGRRPVDSDPADVLIRSGYADRPTRDRRESVMASLRRILAEVARYAFAASRHAIHFRTVARS